MASKTKRPPAAKTMVRRYEIHLISLDSTAGREVNKTRPCVVISPDAMHGSGMAVVCPLTTSLHPQWAHRMQITCAAQAAEIMADQIRAVSISRFVRRLDTLSKTDAETLRNLISLLYATP
jgi:mRNA interferase MazF